MAGRAADRLPSAGGVSRCCHHSVTEGASRQAEVGASCCARCRASPFQWLGTQVLVV
jgi:hypothetical protein